MPKGRSDVKYGYRQRADLYRMRISLAGTVIERHRRRLKRKAERITIDLDPTDDPTHGSVPRRRASAPRLCTIRLPVPACPRI